MIVDRDNATDKDYLLRQNICQYYFITYSLYITILYQYCCANLQTYVYIYVVYKLLMLCSLFLYKLSVFCESRLHNKIKSAQCLWFKIVTVLFPHLHATVLYIILTQNLYKCVHKMWY